jgi:hypothetical protein
LGQLHPEFQAWLLRDFKDLLRSKGYCEDEDWTVTIILILWLSAEERVVYEEMFTGSPHQLGVYIPNDLGYRNEKVEVLNYINLMVVMTDNQNELIWKRHLNSLAKDYKSRRAEHRSRKLTKKLLKDMPLSKSLAKD